MLRYWIEGLIWAALSVAAVFLTRDWQPSWTLAVLAVLTLNAASAALLHGGRVMIVGRRGAVRGLGLALAALGAGVAAALVIRGLYVWLAPDVTPFSLAFNIASDTVWVIVHALLVGGVTRLLQRR